jgi:hypothetical protein
LRTERRRRFVESLVGNGLGKNGTADRSGVVENKFRASQRTKHPEEVGGPRVAVYKRTENGPIAFITTETASHLNSRPLLDRIVERDVLQNSGKARLWADSPPYIRIANRTTRYSLGRIKIL